MSLPRRDLQDNVHSSGEKHCRRESRCHQFNSLETHMVEVSSIWCGNLKSKLRVGYSIKSVIQIHVEAPVEVLLEVTFVAKSGLT